MFVLTVRFDIKPDHVQGFREAVLRQAANSRKNEPGCRQFDVCFDSESPTAFFLYEVYDDPAAFERHVSTSYFSEFQATVGPWVESKQRHQWTRAEVV